jgi:2-keto-4-pentenoate hydratase/2-oxohepta-3-ene-1,7-dioic acid hydratase in catechol pathway
MEILRYLANGAERCGIVEGNLVHELDWSLRDALVLAASEREEGLAGSATIIRDREGLTMLPPLVPGGRIICIGINYLEHQRESADVFVADVPKHPIVFLKDASAMTTANAELHLPSSVSCEFDWEVELGVVIGAPARAIKADDAWSVVAGYTVVNDITARDLQGLHVQWTLGKNSEAATPIGPGIVTKGQVGTDPDLAITSRVNNEIKQRARTSELIFDIPSLIETVSAVTPLLPGDVIATGTPSGVGFKRTPPEFLRDGDVVEATIESIGSLVNTVRTGDRTRELV